MAFQEVLLRFCTQPSLGVTGCSSDALATSFAITSLTSEAVNLAGGGDHEDRRKAAHIAWNFNTLELVVSMTAPLGS